MRDVVVSPRARRDLIDIWLYTCTTWGEAQADSYVGALDRCIQALSSNAEAWIQRDELRADYRTVRVGRHVVFYTTSSSTVRVQRILHDQMDQGRHL